MPHTIVTMRGTVLIVEDEQSIAQLLCDALGSAGLQTISVSNTKDADKILQTHKIHVILLDWMLPRTSGISWLEQLKSLPAFSTIPVVMLTARQTEADQIRALNLGADDFITKPFSINTLIARISAVIRRKQPAALNTLQSGDVQVDVKQKKILIGTTATSLPHRTFQLLVLLLQNEKKYLSRDEIIDNVWENDRVIEPRTVDVHIRKIRNLLKSHNSNLNIKTKSKLGYMIEA